MRLQVHQIEIIRRVVKELAGNDSKVSLFGSRIDDNARGGDIDLLVEVIHPVDEPAWLSAKISGRISSMLGGQKIDVVLIAPNIRCFQIHEVAQKEGVTL
jgi:predicted nucleotidyltransferase